MHRLHIEGFELNTPLGSGNHSAGVPLSRNVVFSRDSDKERENRGQKGWKGDISISEDGKLHQNQERDENNHENLFPCQRFVSHRNTSNKSLSYPQS
jgi:hypothetical protein